MTPDISSGSDSDDEDDLSFATCNSPISSSDHEMNGPPKNVVLVGTKLDIVC